MPLSNEVLVKTGYDLYVSEYEDVREQHGGQVGPTQSDVAESILPIMEGYVKELEESWGLDVEWVFSLMGLTEDQYADALYYCLMACRGHGVGLEDHFYDNVKIYEKKMRRKLDTSPIHTELTDINDLAFENFKGPEKGGWAVYAGDGDLVDDKFWTYRHARSFARDVSIEGCTVVQIDGTERLNPQYAS